MSGTGNDDLNAVSTFQPGDEAEAVYDRWADRYDHDLVQNFGYNSPQRVAQTLAAMMPNHDVPIVDHACGTGLSGEALRDAGFSMVDGVDVSAGMIEHAEEKAVYRALFRADLTDPSVQLADAPYEAMTLVGAIGPGHLEPEHLPALMRTVREGAPVVVFYNASCDESHDYTGRMAQLEADGHWVVEQRERSNYMDALDRPGWLVAARRGR